jgi:ParB/RepB/Spo0J family partition protein
VSEKKSNQNRARDWSHLPLIKNIAELAMIKPGLYQINIELLRPMKGQPRTVFEQDKLHELGQSIKSRGVLNPLHVVVIGSGGGIAAEIMGGERRWRAARANGLKTLPAIILATYESRIDFLCDAYVENNHREQYNVIDEAETLEQIMKGKNLKSQGELAKEVNRSVGFVNNTMQYLNLIPEIRKLVKAGTIPKGMARSICSKPAHLQKSFLTQILLATEKKGHPLTQLETSLLVRSLEKKLGVREKDIKPRRGHPRASLQVLLANRIFSLGKQLRDAINNVAKLSRAQLNEKATTFLTVRDELLDICSAAEKLASKINDNVT